MLAALSTCDPGDINRSIRDAKQHRVRVSGAPLRRPAQLPARRPARLPRVPGY